MRVTERCEIRIDILMGFYAGLTARVQFGVANIEVEWFLLRHGFVPYYIEMR